MAHRDPGLGPELISFALAGRPQADHDFFRDFYALLLREYPLTGGRQVRKYMILARRIRLAINRMDAQQQQLLREDIYRRIIAPVGAHLDRDELAATIARLRAVMEDLIGRLGIEVDPADVPNFGEEKVASLRASARDRARTLPEHDLDEHEAME